MLGDIIKPTSLPGPAKGQPVSPSHHPRSRQRTIPGSAERCATSIRSATRSEWRVGREVGDTEKSLRTHTFFQKVSLLARLVVGLLLRYVSSRTTWNTRVGGGD